MNTELNLIDVTVTCQRSDCFNFAVPIQVKMNPDGGNVICGVCQSDVTPPLYR